MGISKFSQESNSEFSEWAVDVPENYLSTVVDEWKKGNPGADEVKEIEGLFEID
jgi:hypothetical protein